MSVEVNEPSAAFQDAEERICDCGAAGSGMGHASFCAWLKSEWKRWGDAYEAATSPATQPKERSTDRHRQGYYAEYRKRRAAEKAART